MKVGDMVKHSTDPQRSRGLITTLLPEGGVMIQWGNGDLIKYEGLNLSYIVPLGWNLYVK
tara:strand:- start:29778 stop:29957 length:180 start_codon:yes stop_codon:yes gene_type:complete